VHEEFNKPAKKRYHGRAGTPVTSSQRAHAREVQDDATDHDHPRRGGSQDRRVTTSIFAGHGMGGPEEILKRNGFGVRK
jgi:hypothetical protein